MKSAFRSGFKLCIIGSVFGIISFFTFLLICGSIILDEHVVNKAIGLIIYSKYFTLSYIVLLFSLVALIPSFISAARFYKNRFTGINLSCVSLLLYASSTVFFIIMILKTSFLWLITFILPSLAAFILTLISILKVLRIPDSDNNNDNTAITIDFIN